MIHFTKQLNRFLKEHDGNCTLHEGTSCPSFSALVEKINPDSIGEIVVYARTGLNQAVKATLACDIVLDEGVASITSSLCAYKFERAKEMIEEFLIPLHLLGLYKKTYLHWNEEEYEPLSTWGAEQTMEELRAIFNLVKYPDAADSSIPYEKEYMEKSCARISTATEISKKGLTPPDAWEGFYTRCPD